MGKNLVYGLVGGGCILSCVIVKRFLVLFPKNHQHEHPDTYLCRHQKGLDDVVVVGKFDVSGRVQEGQLLVPVVILPYFFKYSMTC